MSLVIVAVIILLLGWLWLEQAKKRREDFISLVTKVTYYMERTDMHPINYNKCVGMKGDENRIDSAPFYVKSFENVSFTLGNIASLLQTEINSLEGARVSSVLIITNPNGSLTVHLLFPEFDKDKVRFKLYALIAKSHRWYYLLLYNIHYNAGNEFCPNESNVRQCPGIPVRLVDKNYFFIRYLDYYWTPCGSSQGERGSPLVSRIKQNKFYAHYIPNPRSFNVTPYPNLSFMSQYDTIKFGCDSQLVSENGRFILALEPGSFGVYRVLGGNPFESCFNGGFVAKAAVWRFPLSSRVYATFKIESDYIVLVDYNRTVFKIKVSTPNTPIVLKLNNLGELEIYDSQNNKLRTFDYNRLLQAIRGEPVDGLEVNMDALRDNLKEEQRRQAEADARAKALQEADQQRLRIAEQEDYNKRICPIGS